MTTEQSSADLLSREPEGTEASTVGRDEQMMDKHAWEETYDAVRGGRTVVGVHTPDVKGFAQARDLLQEAGGRDLSEFDSDGARRR